MRPSDSKWVLSFGLLCCAMFYMNSPTVSGASSVLPSLLAKLGATEQQIKDLSPSLSAGSPAGYVQNIRVKRQNETGNHTEVENVTSTENIITTSTTQGITKLPDANSSSPATTIYASSTEVPTVEMENSAVKTKKYLLPNKTTLPPFRRDFIADVPERNGEDEAIVETRPYLLHPSFFTYMLLVTLPCVIGWCLLTFACLWICRPNSPLYREILKRLIEHSQMKQKSVLFSATVLAADKHTTAPTAGEGSSKA